jgi:hypothetical protein
VRDRMIIDYRSTAYVVVDHNYSVHRTAAAKKDFVVISFFPLYENLDLTLAIFKLKTVKRAFGFRYKYIE